MLISVMLNALSLILLIFTDIHMIVYQVLVVRLILKKDEKNIEPINQISLVGHSRNMDMTTFNLKY